MRTKKTAIKTAIITRTIPMTAIRYLYYDAETKEVREDEMVLLLDYNEHEAEQALREKGIKIVDIEGIARFEKKMALDIDTFFRYAHEA